MIFEERKARDYINDLQGFKLENIHFKIGSKFHTDTFIHARVLLQNSYYTSRIALTLAEKICSLCHALNLPNLTLVGYERYSELLLGLIINYLQSLDSNLKVSSCIMIDKGRIMEPIVPLDRLSESFVVIVPIVSTGSTTSKIVRSYNQTVQGSGDALMCYQVFQLSRPGYTIPNSESIYEVPVQWFDPYSCDVCYGDESLPLLEADKTNLNPVVILGLPGVKTVYSIADPLIKKERERIKAAEAKEASEKEEKEEKTETGEIPKKYSFYGCPFQRASFEKSLLYLKSNRYKEFRSFSHLSHVFIEENLNGIEAWIDSLAAEFSIRDTDKIYILSPCHVMTNITFVNLVNNRLFGSSATIIYFEPEKEYAENFKRVHRIFLDEEAADKTKIFYVDDDLVSGKTFFSIYDLFRYSVGYGPVGLTGAIFLMNKANPSVNERVTRASGNVHSYVSINLPQQHLISNEAPFSREIHRYEQIMKRCLYYEPEIACYEKNKTLKNSNKVEKHRNRHLNMFYATHVLYDFFSAPECESKLSGMTFEQLIAECKHRDGRIDDEYAVLKVVSSNSFTMYRPVRDKVFEWIKEELKTVLKDVESLCDNEKWDSIDLLKKMQFLIHRSVNLGNFQIVSPRFFTVLSKVFNVIDDKGLITTVETVFNPSQSVKVPDTFSDSILKRFIELMYSYPASAVKIKEALSSETIVFKNDRGKSFKERLLDETCVVVDDLYDCIVSLGFQAKAIIKGDELVDLDDYRTFVQNWFEQNGIYDYTQYKVAAEICGFDENSLPDNFIQYLWLKSYFYCDSNSLLPSSVLFEKKTVQLCHRLKSMVSPDGPIGAFFVVTDVLGKHRLVFDEDRNGYSVLGNRFNEQEIDDFFTRMGRSIQADSRLLIKKVKDELTSFSDDNHILDALNCKELHIYRLGQIENSSISGIIGFYSADPSMMGPYSRRYMLLLRRDILSFIDLHHRNEEFVQSVLAEERRKYAYLTGHGREVMLRLSWSDKDFIPIIVDMERLQGIFAGSQIDPDYEKVLLNLFFEPDIINIDGAKSLVEDFWNMALKIYQSDVVEISEVPNKWESKATGEGSIKFSKKLLKYICFELIVNAKKNKFHKANTPYRKVYSGDESPFNKNSIGVNITLSADHLVLSVSGTGPIIDSDILQKIKANTQIKEKGDISGLDLIIKLIKKYDTRNHISVSSDIFKSHVKKNTISVTLYSK